MDMDEDSPLISISSKNESKINHQNNDFKQKLNFDFDGNAFAQNINNSASDQHRLPFNNNPSTQNKPRNTSNHNNQSDSIVESIHDASKYPPHVTPTTTPNQSSSNAISITHQATPILNNPHPTINLTRNIPQPKGKKCIKLQRKNANYK